jgi:hypothetical protein
MTAVNGLYTRRWNLPLQQKPSHYATTKEQRCCMSKRRLIQWLLSAAILMFLPTQTRLFAQACGPFVDVSSSDVFCPFILQAFIDSVTQGTSPTTFSPNDLLPRNQVVTFFDRVLDQSLHRGSVRTAIGKTWAPTSTNGGVVTDVGGAINDIVTDGTFLWIARNDGKILKANAADRRPIETWSLVSGVPRKLGVFAGLIWIADDQGALHFFNPTNAPGTATVLFNNATISPGSPTLAFDGTNVWHASSGGTNIRIYPVANSSAATITGPANIDGMVFDGTNMWVLLANSAILKVSLPTAAAPVPATVETLTIPGPVSDCRMVYDGSNIWIPIGATGNLYVIRPTVALASLPSSIVKSEAIPDVAFPYVATFDTENVMIGGLNNGTVALYKATNLTRIRTFVTGAAGVRGIASDGRTFNVGDYLGTKFFQF